MNYVIIVTTAIWNVIKVYEIFIKQLLVRNAIYFSGDWTDIVNNGCHNKMKLKNLKFKYQAFLQHIYS